MVMTFRKSPRFKRVVKKIQRKARFKAGYISKTLVPKVPKHNIASTGSGQNPDVAYRWLEFVKVGSYNTNGMSTTVGANIRLNDITQPDATSACPNLADYGDIYKKFEVIGAKMSMWVTNQSALGTPAVLNLYAGDSTTDAPSNTTECFTQDNVKNKMIPAFASSGASNSSEIKGYWITTKYTPMSKLRRRAHVTTLDDGTCQTGALVAPTGLIYCCPTLFTLTGGSGTGILNGYYFIKVSYYVRFYNKYDN